MATQAMVPFGATVSLGDGADPEVFTKIAEVFEILMPEQTRDTVDATHFESPGRTREFLPSWGDGGEFTVNCNFTAAGYTKLKAVYDAAETVNVRVALASPATTKMEFAGVPIGLSSAWPMDDKMTATLTFKVSGQPTYTA